MYGDENIELWKAERVEDHVAYKVRQEEWRGTESRTGTSLMAVKVTSRRRCIEGD